MVFGHFSAICGPWYHGMVRKYQKNGQRP